MRQVDDGVKVGGEDGDGDTVETETGYAAVGVHAQADMGEGGSGGGGEKPDVALRGATGLGRKDRGPRAGGGGVGAVEEDAFH